MTVVYWPWISLRDLLLRRRDDRGWQCPVLVTPIPAVKSR